MNTIIHGYHRITVWQRKSWQYVTALQRLTPALVAAARSSLEAPSETVGAMVGAYA